MTTDRNQDQTQADRVASGTGRTTNDEERDPTDMLPGVTARGATVLPDTGGSSDASRAEGTIGAVGETDFTGAPAGTSGASSLSGASSSGDTQGGASGGAGGATSSGGTGTGTSPDDPGPQSIESTLAVLGDSEQSTPTE